MFLRILFLFFVLLGLAPSVFGATDTFLIQTLVGGDVTPPSIPGGLTATPVATSQINLSWATSTDDTALDGYQVFRDGIQIATSTVTSYEDVGLAPSTTYAYYVTAFDIFSNVSASSSVATATTFAVVTPPPEDDGRTYGFLIRLPELISLKVIPGETNALIRYETKGDVRGTVKWGTTISYEIGSSVERAFRTYHETTLTGLTSDTQYRFTIQGENHLGRFGVLTESSFRTLGVEDTVPPGNVMNFRAERRGADVILAWENPRDDDFARVRILRSDKFYPSDSADGWVVYEGSGTEKEDSNILTLNTRLFYTIFTYDENGNISSGAVVSIAHQDAPPLDIADPTKNDLDITFNDIEFYQEGMRLGEEGTNIKIHGGRHLTIAIPYDRLPEHLKTILVTLAPKNRPEELLQFLLRANEEKTFYTARLAPLGIANIFLLRVSIFDFKTAQVGYTEGTVESFIRTYEDTARDERVSGSILAQVREFLTNYYAIPFILLLLVLLYLSRRLMYARW